jgi:Xaa-Pro aminopeptidase
VPGYDLYGHIASEHLFGEGGRVVVQSDDLRVAAFEALKKQFAGVFWVPVENFLGDAVAVKDHAALDKIRSAQRLTDEVFEHILGLLEPGISEHEVAAEITYQHMRRGASRLSFDPIVASGPNGALPHARATGRTMQSGELVVLDFGCVLDGYVSDMTRTVALADPGADARRVYDVVLDAQRRAVDAARGGMVSRALDKVARDVIEGEGFGPFFSHSLGHGVGLEVHEWPGVSYRSDAVLPVGAVITIEPGVYLPGRFGVRIEDMVVLQDEGCEVLTRSPKELLVL